MRDSGRAKDGYEVLIHVGKRCVVLCRNRKPLFLNYIELDLTSGLERTSRIVRFRSDTQIFLIGVREGVPVRCIKCQRDE
jgi:hypothetical protein